jgi:hypothetical protein
VKASVESSAVPSRLYGQRTGRPDPACAAGDYDPEWWVHDHLGPCSKDCPHTLAVHICLWHCPVVQRCQELAVDTHHLWAGMVMGGMLWNSRAVPGNCTPKTTCTQCDNEEGQDLN